MDIFVGRDNPVRAIRDELKDMKSQKNIRILSISGPAGVGKTFLLDHALSELDLDHLRYLPLRVDGNTNSVTLADIIFRDLISTQHPKVGNDARYFRVTRQAWEHLQWMDAAARAELERIAKDDEDLAKLVAALYEGVVGLLELIPTKKAKKMSRFAKRIRGQDVENLVHRVRRAKAYREEKGRLFGLLPVGRAAKERNLLRKDLQGSLAEYVTIDLAAILSGYRPEDWKRYLPSKVDGLDRCLMIFDDYETLEPTLDDFLRRELLRRLEKAKFQTVIIILGRDGIRDVDFAWEQYFGKNIVLDLRLAALSEDESRQYLEALGIHDGNARERIIRNSLGLPFLLAAEAEFELQGGSSALSLQKFVDRTTRWMTQEQKAWALSLAFLEDVNEDTVRHMLPDNNPMEVVEWFKQEASIRSPEAGKWRMLPIIRSRFQASVQNDSPNQYRIYKEKSSIANQQL
ncbi:MAG: AAA family ATPase [Deltaproteobacteria bacterium]|nr:AAA family ATPase [Deltaproteobacteria bacterium]